jgi:hypothetical protein
VISFLLKDLPDDNAYQVLFLRRDLDEVIASQDKMIARLGTQNASADAEAMKEAYRNDIVRARLHCKGALELPLPGSALQEHDRRPGSDDACRQRVPRGQARRGENAPGVQGELYRNRRG